MSAAAGGGRHAWRERRELVLIAVTVAVAVVVGIVNHGFLTLDNLRFILLNSVVLSVVALGQTLVIAMRGIDLSVAPLMGLSAMVCGLLAAGHGLPLWGAVGVALGIGLVLGTLNGVLVAALNIPPIITTLGTYSLFGGLTFLYSDGTQVDQVPPAYAAFGNAGPLGLPTPVLVLLAVMGLCWFALNHSGFGRAVLAVGNNAVAAYNAGLPVTASPA